ADHAARGPRTPLARQRERLAAREPARRLDPRNPRGLPTHRAPARAHRPPLAGGGAPLRRHQTRTPLTMYRYDHYDHALVAERVAQFRDQTQRFLAGKLTEDEFRPLRLRNGLYIQRHAPMLRVAVPYGLLSSTQLRMLAHIARKYDRGYGHFT